MRCLFSIPIAAAWRRLAHSTGFACCLLLLFLPEVSRSAAAYTGGASSPRPGSERLIVVGFLGGNIHSSDRLRKEALLARRLQETYPLQVHAGIFANCDGEAALKSILNELDTDGNGYLSNQERQRARIVLYGHSWGASQTVTLAGRLDQMHIPVLLTIQVDSVQKHSQHDGRIPANVREAVNFYQSEGLLRGRSLITASNPTRTTILGNYQSSYRQHPVSCAGFPWYARLFMRPHIEIENDAEVWSRVEALIRARVL